MQAAAPAIVERAAHERGELALLDRDLLDEQAEQEALVGRRDHLLVPEVDLERGGVELAGPSLDREPTLLRRLDHRVDRPARVDGRPGAVDAVRRQVDGLPPALGPGFEQVELGLEREHRLQAHRAPRFHGQAKHPAGVDVERRPLLLDVGDADDRVLLPTRPQGVAVDERLDVGQAHVELLTGDVEDLLVGGEGVDADAERGVTGVGDVAEQVLPAFDTEHVREQESEPFALDVHPRSSLGPQPRIVEAPASPLRYGLTRGRGLPARDRTPPSAAVPAGGPRRPGLDVLRPRAHALVPGAVRPRGLAGVARAPDRRVRHAWLRPVDRRGSGDGRVPRHGGADGPDRRGHRGGRDRVAHASGPKRGGDRARGGGGSSGLGVREPRRGSRDLSGSAREPTIVLGSP